MKFRTLVIACLAAVFFLPCFSGGERTKMIAAVLSSDQPRYRNAHRAFIKSLAARGYDVSTVQVVLQSPNPDPLSWSNSIRKFNAYRPAIILAYGAPVANVAFKEADGIPVVAADVYATENNFKAVTGVSSHIPLVTLVKAVQGIHPYRRIGVLYTAREYGSRKQADDIRSALQPYGAKTVEANVTSSASLDAALNSLFLKTDLIVVTESSYSCRQFDHIVSRATERSIPVISTMPDAADKGALVSLEINPQEQGYLAAEVVVRILEGANPASLSILMPRRVDLNLNLRAAKKLKITLPFQILGSATRIVK